MPKTPDQLLEAETIIRWDETGEKATLWTASIAVKRTWVSFGFPVETFAGGHYKCSVPADRITYKPMKKA